MYIYPHHGIPHRGVVDPPRTTTLRLRQPTVRTVLGSRIPRLPISFTPRVFLSLSLSLSFFPSTPLLAPQPSFLSYPHPSSPSPPPRRRTTIFTVTHHLSFHFPFRFSFCRGRKTICYSERAPRMKRRFPFSGRYDRYQWLIAEYEPYEFVRRGKERK